MARSWTLLCAAALLGGYAPLQCGEADPAKAIEETPGEALYRLAGQFRAEGKTDSWEATLRYLMRNYPSSRFSLMAAADLEEAGLDAGVPDAAP